MFPAFKVPKNRKVKADIKTYYPPNKDWQSIIRRQSSHPMHSDRGFCVKHRSLSIVNPNGRSIDSNSISEV